MMRLVTSTFGELMSTDNDLEASAAIEHALLLYTRGIDRLDPALLAAAFHSEAVLEGYGPKERRVEAFAPFAVKSLRQAYRATQHRLSNTFVQFDGGDAADVETYVVADHFHTVGDTEVIDTFAGRYIDRFERRDGRWAIVKRSLRCDWTRRDNVSAHMPGEFIDSPRG